MGKVHAYIPPENPPYANMNFFQDLEETLLNLGAESVILAGDLNARTAGLRDFIESCDILDDMVDYESTTDLMKRYNINKDRWGKVLA